MDSLWGGILPPPASNWAQEVDPLFNFLVYMSVFFFVLIAALVVIFTIKYRRRRGKPATAGGDVHNPLLEALWVAVPTVLVLVIFFWGFKGFLKMSVMPAGAMEVKVSAQKWFWSFDYPEGVTTVNELVVPVDKPVRLVMSSRDVIHSFFVPAFRLKRDVLPNRYNLAWFRADRTGEFPLLCAEYCGTKHSQMLGLVRVVSEREFWEWLDMAGNAGAGMTPVEYGAKLFTGKACNTCHSLDGTPGNGPSLLAVFGHTVRLKDGSTLVADENYVRESILSPAAKVVGGYQPIMPTYQGLLKERELDALVAFVKSLGRLEPGAEPSPQARPPDK